MNKDPNNNSVTNSPSSWKDDSNRWFKPIPNRS